jgi:hypothetical protein
MFLAIAVPSILVPAMVSLVAENVRKGVVDQGIDLGETFSQTEPGEESKLRGKPPRLDENSQRGKDQREMVKGFSWLRPDWAEALGWQVVLNIASKRR